MERLHQVQLEAQLISQHDLFFHVDLAPKDPIIWTK
jgi:hypothetical protein